MNQPSLFEQRPKERGVQLLDSWQLSPRVAIVPGTRIRVSRCGGEVVRTFRGVWIVRRIERRGSRIYFEIQPSGALKQDAGTFTIFVAGRSYHRHGFKWTPYKIRRVT